MTQRRHMNILAICLIAAAMALAGCSGSDNSNTSQNKAGSSGANATAQSAATPQVKGTVKLAYVEWASCLASTNVVASVLQNVGYKVKTISVTGAMLYKGLATKDVDAMVCAWLPVVHKNYYDKVKNQVVNLGPNMKGTKIGLVVPDYVKIDSIADLENEKTAKKFDNRIVGIDPGAGEMAVTQKAIKAYNLPEKLAVGSGATMTAALKNAIRQHKPIVVTLWTPHWAWARWDLRYLKDPKGIYGKPANIDTLVRKGLKQDMPKAYAILKAFKWTPEEMGAVMAADTKQGADPMQDAQDWVQQHADKVSAWLGN